MDCMFPHAGFWCGSILDEDSMVYQERRYWRRCVPLLSVLLFCLLLLCRIPMASASHESSVQVGIFDNKPMCYLDSDGKPAGIFVAVIEAVAAQNEWNLDYVQGSFSDLRKQLQAGEIDILLSTAISTERQKIYAYNEVDVFNNWAEIYVATKSDINSLLGLRNKRVATLKSGIYSTGPEGIYHLDKKFQLNCDFLEVADYRGALEAVRIGKADAAVVNRLAGAAYAEGFGLVKSGIVFAPVEVRFALTKGNPATPSHIAAIDRGLKTLIGDPESSYHQAINAALGGSGSTGTVIPKRMWWMIVLGSVALFVLIVVAFLLRWQIQHKTARLVEANSYSKQIIACAQEGIVVFDLEGRFQGWNPYMESLSGKTAAQVMGKHPCEAFPFLEGSETLDQLQRALAGETLPGLDLAYQIPKTEEKGWVSVQNSSLKDSRGKLIGVISIIREITGQKRAASTIKKNEKMLRNLVESTSTVPWELDLKSHKFNYMGKQIEDILGYPVESWKDMGTWATRLHAQDRDGAVEYCNMENAKGMDHDFVYRAIHRDGSLRWIRDVVSVVKERGKVVKLVGFMHDITEGKTLALEKEELESRLQQAQKMEAIGTLAGGIAHDFNNILGAVLGYAELAREASDDGSLIAQDLDKVLESGNRAKDLVKQILAFSRQGGAERVALQPVVMIKEVLKMLRASLPTTIAIQEHMETNAGFVYADPTQIHQIVMNLCTNAFHAMEESGGILDISVKSTFLGGDDLVHEPDVEAGEFVQISVADTGPGIDVGIREKIFNPYFTTKETGKGTGMGLSIVHGIVKSYGGIVSLHSEPGEGTVFHVFLPAVEKKKPPVREEGREEVLLGSECILFVDDERVLVEMGKDMLEKLGYEVTVRSSSLEALETFQNQPEHFDLVITDQTMPGMTGVDLARRLLQIRPDIPIILCTGYSAIVTTEQARSMGIKEFIYKPVAQRDFAILIRKVLDGS